MTHHPPPNVNYARNNTDLAIRLAGRVLASLKADGYRETECVIHTIDELIEELEARQVDLQDARDERDEAQRSVQRQQAHIQHIQAKLAERGDEVSYLQGHLINPEVHAHVKQQRDRAEKALDEYQQKPSPLIGSKKVGYSICLSPQEYDRLVNDTAPGLKEAFDRITTTAQGDMRYE